MLTPDEAKLIAAQVVEQLDADEWLDREALLATLPFERTRLDELRGRGLFPEGFKVGRARYWTRGEIREWRRKVAAGEIDLTNDLETTRQRIEGLRLQKRAAARTRTTTPKLAAFPARSASARNADDPR